MNDKDLLFILSNGEEFIKAKYIADEDKIYYLSVDENKMYSNIEELEEHTLHIYEENKFEVNCLIEEMQKDNMIHEKIKNNQGEKLMFRYESEEFNRFIEELTQG